MDIFSRTPWGTFQHGTEIRRTFESSKFSLIIGFERVGWRVCLICSLLWPPRWGQIFKYITSFFQTPESMKNQLAGKIDLTWLKAAQGQILVYIPLHPSTGSIHPSIYPTSMNQSIHLQYPSIYLPTKVSVHPSIHPSTHLTTHPPTGSTHPSIIYNINPSIHLLSIHLPTVAIHSSIHPLTASIHPTKKSVVGRLHSSRTKVNRHCRLPPLQWRKQKCL